MKRGYQLIAVLLLVIVFSGCAVKSTVISIKQPDVLSITEHQNDAENAALPTAGAISVDITPQPGLSMGGYSVMANRGKGFRTRIKARVIYLNDGQGNATALVQTDLPSSSLLLHHKVASLVFSKTGLRPGDIAITASHSHSAPANFFENDFYNKHMSSEKWLNESYFNFISQQISSGIIQAYQTRQPAKVSTGSREIYGYNRNRSIKAYRRNLNHKLLNAENSTAIFEAVNPMLNMIRVDVKDAQGEYFPLAAFSSFSVHATAMSPKVDVYNADLFAYAQKDLEWEIQTQYKTPWPVIHALTSGTQGDMAPALPLRGDNYFSNFDVDWMATKVLGQNIAKEAIILFNALSTGLTSDIRVKTASHEINIRNNSKIGNEAICQDAAIGNPVVGGAYERRTPWLSLIPFFKAGSLLSHRWVFTDGCHGNKSHVGFSFIQALLEPKDSFPQIVLFQIIRVNDTAILPLPFEVTVEAGRRISAGVRSAITDDKGLNHVWVLGNANGYFGYTTTPEEYDQQNYEGGHTLYGRGTTPYLQAQLTRLAKTTNGDNSFHEMLDSWLYTIKVNDKSNEQVTSVGKRHTIQEPQLIMSNAENYFSFQWLDVGSSEILFHKPLVSVEVRRNNRPFSKQWRLMFNGSEPVNDEGYDIEIRQLSHRPDGMAIYEARWYNPIGNEEYRFVIEKRKNQNIIYSKIF